MPILDFVTTFSVVLFASIFLVSGLTKVFARKQFRSTLQQLNILSGRLVTLSSILLPIIEIGIAILIFWGHSTSVLIGSAAGLALLIFFSGIAALAIRLGRTDVECSCFGPFARSTFSPGLIVRNICLGLVGVFVFALPSVPLIRIDPILNYPKIIPVVLPVLAIFPLYTLSQYFLTTQNYNRPPANTSNVSEKHERHKGAQIIKNG